MEDFGERRNRLEVRWEIGTMGFEKGDRVRIDIPDERRIR